LLQNFRRTGTIQKKYYVLMRTAAANVTAGYQTGVIGFG